MKSEAPDGVALITAGVDVQADRLEVEIVGWGRDEESWSIAHHVIPGDVMRNEVWDHLEGLLLPSACTTPARRCESWPRASIADSRMRTVLRFTRDRYARRVYAVKGRAGESPIWPRKPSRKNQTPFFMVGVDAAKTALYDRLKIQEPGPGYLPLPDWARPGVLRSTHRREEVHALSQRLSRSRNGESRRRRGTKRWTAACTLMRRCTRSTQAV